MAVIAIVICALGTISKNANDWCGRLSLPCIFGSAWVVSHAWYRSHLPESVVSLICGKLQRNGFDRPRKTPENWRVVDDDADAAGNEDDVDTDDTNDIDDSDNRDDDYDDNDDDDE